MERGPGSPLIIHRCFFISSRSHGRASDSSPPHTHVSPPSGEFNTTRCLLLLLHSYGEQRNQVASSLIMQLKPADSAAALLRLQKAPDDWLRPWVVLHLVPESSSCTSLPCFVASRQTVNVNLVLAAKMDFTVKNLKIKAQSSKQYINMYVHFNCSNKPVQPLDKKYICIFVRWDILISQSDNFPPNYFVICGTKKQSRKSSCSGCNDGFSSAHTQHHIYVSTVL